MDFCLHRRREAEVLSPFTAAVGARPWARLDGLGSMNVSQYGKPKGFRDDLGPNFISPASLLSVFESFS